MFWHDKSLLNSTSPNIRLVWSGQVILASTFFAQPHLSWQDKSDVELGLIQQAFIISTGLNSADLSNLSDFVIKF